MTLPKALAFVCVVAAMCGVIGAVLGWLIGALAPDAYAIAFSWPGAPEGFDPIQVGVALGLAQDIIGGRFVGVLLVAIVTWYEVRMADIRSKSLGSAAESKTVSE